MASGKMAGHIIALAKPSAAMKATEMAPLVVVAPRQRTMPSAAEIAR